MEFLEKDLEELMFNASNEELATAGISEFDCLGTSIKRKRQLRIGNYGVADMVTFTKSYNCSSMWDEYGVKPVLEVNVYELKKDGITVSAFFQALRYAKGIKSFLCKRGFYEVELNIVLVGRLDLSIKSDVVYLNDVFDNVRLYGYTYSMDGLNFKEIINYSLVDEGFNLKK